MIGERELTSISKKEKELGHVLTVLAKKSKEKVEYVCSGIHQAMTKIFPFSSYVSALVHKLTTVYTNAFLICKNDSSRFYT